MQCLHIKTTFMHQAMVVRARLHEIIEASTSAVGPPQAYELKAPVLADPNQGAATSISPTKR